jgi:ATP-dependent Lhr-like helicase
MVRNIVSQENIGMLDEAFVANNIEVGTVIIFKGAAWKVISLDEDISVEPALDVAGAIPSWIGEEIPVPMEVALEVAQIRGEPRMIEDYPANEYTKRLALSKVKRHLKKGIPVPDNTLILVELFENFVIIHSPFGTKVNQTIGRLFSVLLTSKIGSSVALQTDAYRVILHVPIKISEEEIKELFSTDSEAIEPILSKTLKRTSLFKWRFMHVARRFGILSKDVQYIDRMIRTYEESIVYREALKEVFRENLDIENTKKVFRDIKSGNLRVETISLPKPSPIGELGLKGYREVIVPERADKMIIQALKDRLSKKRLEVFCLYCADWSSSYRVGSIKDLKCGKCGARMLSVLKKNEKDLKRIYKKFRAGEKISEEEKKEVVKMQTCANLVLSYGKRAILAFAARGIGPEVAKRVLPAKDEQELYRNILKAERDFVRTKKFWQ